MSHRVQQVEEAIRRAVSEVLIRGLNDPRVQGMVSVLRVQVSPDLSEAYVWVSVTPEDRQKLAVEGLNAAARHIQGELSKRVRLRRLPRLSFRGDSTLKRQAEVYDAIRQGMDREQTLADGRSDVPAGPDDPAQAGGADHKESDA